MKAWTYASYGTADVLEFRDVDEPEIADDEILVRVRSGGANAMDRLVLHGVPTLIRLGSGLGAPRKPLIIGSDVAGIVEQVGSKVTRFRGGDAVYAEVDNGGFAELVSVKERMAAAKPVTLSFEQAAAVPMAGMTALQALRDKADVQPGNRVLVHGASGGVGTFAVQIAKAFGAEVTAVCSTGAIDLVRSLGADHVIDYMKDDVTQGGGEFDVVLGIGGDTPPGDYRRVMARKGTFVCIGGSGSRFLGPASLMLRTAALSPFVSQRMVPLAAGRRAKYLEALGEMIDAGTLAPAIERVFPLAEVPEAIHRLESGHVLGKLVVSVAAG